MRKTQRRKLYSRRRRQRGKGLGKAICAGALITAISMMPPAAAADPTFYDLAHKYATEGGWENSNNLALFLTKPSNYIPPSVSSLFQYNTDSGEVEATSCALPTGIDEQQVLKPYVLESGKRYKITSGPTTGDIRKDIIVTFKRLIPGDEDSPAEYVLERESDNYEGSPTKGEEYYISEKEVTLSPVGGGRKQRRKTLRRKK